MLYVIGLIIAIFFVLFICGNGFFDNFGNSIENMFGFVNNKNRFTTEKSYNYLNPTNIETVQNIIPTFEDNMMFNQSTDNLETFGIVDINSDCVSVRGYPNHIQQYQDQNNIWKSKYNPMENIKLGYGNNWEPLTNMSDLSGYLQQNHKICSCVDNKCECKSIMKTKENLANMIDFSGDIQQRYSTNCLCGTKICNQSNSCKSKFNLANNNENFYNPSYTQQLNSIGNMMLGNMKGLNIGTDYVSPKRTCMRHFGPDGDYQGHNVTYWDDLREHDLRKLFNVAMSNKYQIKGVPSYNKSYCNKRLADAFKYCQLNGSCINNTLTDSGCSWQYM